VTSVVRATPQVNGRGQNYPCHHTHTPYPTVTKYCTRDYVHHICPHATFDQDRPMGYFSPYSQVITQYFTGRPVLLFTERMLFIVTSRLCLHVKQRYQNDAAVYEEDAVQCHLWSLPPCHTVYQYDAAVYEEDVVDCHLSSQTPCHRWYY